MNLFLFFLILSTFSAAIRGMHPELRHLIQTFYEGDFRTVLDLYNGNETEDRSTAPVDPCERHSEMGILLDREEYTSIQIRNYTSLNTNMALTFDGQTNFSIHAIKECVVIKGYQRVFEFFVLLLPERARKFIPNKLNFVPVYLYATIGDWQLFAVKDVYNFLVFKTMFAGTSHGRTRIRESLQHPRNIDSIANAVNLIRLDTLKVLKWKIHLEELILILDEENDVQIPGIVVIKSQIHKQYIQYMYYVMFGRTADINWLRDPLRYGKYSQNNFMYRIYNTGNRINNLWAFSLDSNFVDDTKYVELPPFLAKLGL